MADIKGHIMEHLMVGSLAEPAALVVAAADMRDGEHQSFVHTVSSFRFRVGMAAISRWV